MNVTPDSFSDGGRWFDPAAAIAHGRAMAAEGADLIDVGGESTRPGARPVAIEEEMRRVLPVVEALAEVSPVSIDTRKAEVARAAVRAGASVINDVSAQLWPVAADTGAGWVAMHMPADPAVMQCHARYEDVVAEVCEYVVTKADRARGAGVSQVWIDPGIGFGKTAAHNLLLLRHLRRFVASGLPVLVGTSRKAFLGAVASRPGEETAPAGDRLDATVATTAWSVLQGVDLIRVHDVEPAVMAARLAGGDFS